VRVELIESFDLPELAPLRTLRYQTEHRQQGIFVAENEKVVRRLIESDLTVLSVVVPEKWAALYQELLSRRADSPPLFIGSKKLLEQLAGYSMYQGIMAVGKVPVQPPLDSLIEPGRRPVLLAAADGLTSAQNIGALARCCAAFGATALLTGETSCSPFLRRAVAASAGTIFRLPALELPDLAATLKHLRQRGVHCIAAHPHAQQKSLPQADFRGDCCIVFGSEGEGISPAILDQCDSCVAIPMPPDIDSLNVACAASVFLYEASRQRTRGLAAPST